MPERQTALAKVERQLRTPRPARPNIERLRDALNQRAAEWRETLRAEPKIARTLLRRLVGPLTMWDHDEATARGHKAFVEWETSLSPALIEGLAEIQVMASHGDPVAFTRCAGRL